MMSHADLLRALESHDPEQAEKAMREHLRTSRGLVEHLFRPGPGPLPRQEI
jgi:DNA-binding GntR family transcriptional regulator